MLHRNLGLKLAALGLAVFLWFWVLHTERNVLVSDSTRVAVTPTDLPPGLTLGAPLSSVEVRVRGRRSDLARTRRLLKASVSCKGRESGRHTLPVNVVAPAELTIDAIKPSKITLRLKVEERPVVRTLPVIVRSRGALPEGLRIASVKVDPPMVAVTGPEAKVRRVSQVQTDQLALDTLASQPTQELSLAVPSGVTLLGQRSVTVTITLARTLPLGPAPGQPPVRQAPGIR